MTTDVASLEQPFSISFVPRQLQNAELWGSRDVQSPPPPVFVVPLSTQWPLSGAVNVLATGTYSTYAPATGKASYPALAFHQGISAQPSNEDVLPTDDVCSRLAFAATHTTLNGYATFVDLVKPLTLSHFISILRGYSLTSMHLVLVHTGNADNDDFVKAYANNLLALAEQYKISLVINAIRLEPGVDSQAQESLAVATEVYKIFTSNGWTNSQVETGLELLEKSLPLDSRQLHTQAAAEEVDEVYEMAEPDVTEDSPTPFHSDPEADYHANDSQAGV